MSPRHYILHTISLILSIAGLSLLLFQPVSALAQGFDSGGPVQPVQLPETLDEARDVILRVLIALPKAFINAFQEGWGVLKQTIKWLWAQWDKYIWSWIKSRLQDIWQIVIGLIGQEVEKRKPLLQQELEQEKEELKQEAQEQLEKASQGLWERFKELVKSKL